MTLVVEDGTGLSTAESYLSIADIEAYFAKYGREPSGWSALTTTQKEQRARQAAQYLDMTYINRWKGVRVVEEQALSWPRAGVEDQDGWGLDSDSVPQRVKDAQAELVARATANELLTDVDTPGTIASKSVSLGPLSESVSYVGGSKQQKEYTVVDRLLEGLLEYGGGIARLIRT